MDDRKLLDVVIYSKIIRNSVKITAYSASALLMLVAIVLKFNGAAFRNCGTVAFLLIVCSIPTSRFFGERQRLAEMELGLRKKRLTSISAAPF